MENQKDGVKVGGRIVQAVRFADDQAMVANTNAGLQRTMDSLRKTSEDYGMKINLEKTKVMRISRNEWRKITIKIDV
jgi:ribosome-interacting GTPase 1